MEDRYRPTVFAVDIPQGSFRIEAAPEDGLNRSFYCQLTVALNGEKYVPYVQKKQDGKGEYLSVYSVMWLAGNHLKEYFTQQGLTPRSPLWVALLQCWSPFYVPQPKRGQLVFNEQGVCLNAGKKSVDPRHSEKFNLEAGKETLTLFVAQAPNRMWGYSFCYLNELWGRSNPMSHSPFCNSFNYPGKEQALAAGVDFLKVRTRVRPAMQVALDGLVGERAQLSLF